VRRTTLQRHEKRQKQERRLLVAVDFAAPLEGVTVLEVGAFMAAPFATMQLADLGARVLKIENPIGGDPVRATGPFLDGESSPFVRLNRNKESVALDLKSAEGKAAFLRLAERADVLVENLRPGAMTGLGFGYDAIREINPRIVYASASGWGQDGPLASLPGLDIMAQARGGLMSITGTPDGDPVKIGVPICDLVCALYVALGVTAALKERDRSGVGQYLDVSLLESGVSFAIWEAGKYFATGEVGHPLGSAHQSTAPYQALRSADGYITAGAVTDKTWAAFCAALGLEHIRDDERYATGSIRHGHRDTLIPAIEAVTSTRTTADLIATLDAAGVPCAPIADYGQVFTDDHLNQRGYFWDAPHPALGPIRQLGSPMRLSRTPARQDCAGPQLGNSTRAALEWAEIPSAEVTALLDSGVAADPAHPSAALPEVPAPSADDRPI
jgi:crotonobetainyl-CoA:carnitine CoA-transferase CaiB-like acyl-CoA transferase